MAKRKPTNKYYFSVEGETEQWYLKWLQDTINILHMTNCNASFSHRKQYITPINRAFGEKFQNMDEFKEENNFKRCLKKMDLSNVIAAVDRARKIMQRNQENGYTLYQYKGYQYYKENPSLAAWEAIEKILKDCELA